MSDIAKPTTDQFYNRYSSKKSLTSILLNGALFACNASQLKLILTKGFINTSDPKWFICIILICLSLTIQIIMLCFQGIITNSNIVDDLKKNFLNKLNNINLVLTAIVFCVNIFSNIFVHLNDQNNRMFSGADNILTNSNDYPLFPSPPADLPSEWNINFSENP
jgi:hypothetical protein